VLAELSPGEMAEILAGLAKAARDLRASVGADEVSVVAETGEDNGGPARRGHLRFRVVALLAREGGGEVTACREGLVGPRAALAPGSSARVTARF
jgi:diadenosine tetraphosphate (Ap4A) HIT family hydrolase